MLRIDSFYGYIIGWETLVNKLGGEITESLGQGKRIGKTT